MHARYILLNAIFLIPTVSLLLLRWRQVNIKYMLYTLLVMCVLTAAFDNLMIVAGIMTYNPAEISGIMIGRAPIEDFSYTLTAVLLIAVLWGRGKPDEDAV